MNRIFMALHWKAASALGYLLSERFGRGCTYAASEAILAADMWADLATLGSLIIVLGTLILSILFLVRPDKHDKGDIKYIIVDP